MEQKHNICSLCSASNTFKVKYFQLKDAIRPPDGSQFDGFTELHGVLENILNINGKDRETTNHICQKCRDKLHGIYSFTLQHTESEKIIHQITDVTVRLKKLKTFFVLTDLKKEFEAIAGNEKDVNSLEYSSAVCHNFDVSSLVVKMECDNNFEGIDFNKVMKDLNVKYSNAADGKDVEQRKIDLTGSEDGEQITIEDEIIKEEWTLQEGVIFESKEEHDISNGKQTKFGCDVCNEEFATVSCFNEHTKNVYESDLHEFHQPAAEHSEGNSQRFDTKNEFACDQCDAKYKSRRGLKNHKLFHAGISFKCDQCDATYKSKYTLNDHKQIHKGILFNCDQCDGTYKSKYSLNEHKQIHKGILFNCDQCDATYKRKSALNEHKEIHKGILFNCDQCNATYKRKHTLNQHKQIHKGILFNCDQCDATYKRKLALNRHKQIHKGILFKCDQCDATYKSKHGLNLHIQVHKGILFNCDQCDATYKRKLALNQHKQIHEGILFNCGQCDEKFTTYNNLRHHKRSHAGLNFTCNQCDGRFFDESSLIQHLRVAHTDSVFSCDHCDTTYKSTQDLNVHKQNHNEISFDCD